MRLVTGWGSARAAATMIDLTPQLAPYASEQVAFSRYGGHVGIITASDDPWVRVVTIGADGLPGELRTVHHSTADLTALALSADGTIAAFSSAHLSTGLEHSILTAKPSRQPGGALGRRWHRPRGPRLRARPRRLPAGRDQNASGRERASSGMRSRARAVTFGRRADRRHRALGLVAGRYRAAVMPDRAGRAATAGLGPAADVRRELDHPGRGGDGLPLVRPRLTSGWMAARSWAAGRVRRAEPADRPRSGDRAPDPDDPRQRRGSAGQHPQRHSSR